MSIFSCTPAARAARIAKLLELCNAKACSTIEIGAALGVPPKRVCDYARTFVNDGKLFKVYGLSNKRRVIFYAASLEEARHAAEFAADAFERIVRKTWSTKPPAMFEPMAYLFGRVAS